MRRTDVHHRQYRRTTGPGSPDVGRPRAQYGASVAAYDRVEREILGMADMLSTGIIRQFPHRFS